MGRHHNSSPRSSTLDSGPEAPTCVLDQRVINEDTIGNLTDMGISFFATLCGKNRGAFVLKPPDGHTWGCTSLPPDFAELAGASTNITLKDANAIKESFIKGNMTAEDTVEVLDFFTKMVYHSTANKEKEPYACDVGGLARLQCDPVNTLKTVRSATLAGLFTPAHWATGGKPLSLHEAKNFYTMEDFRDMKDTGLNMVQIPFPVMAFAETNDDDDNSAELLDLLTEILGMVQDADLQAILLLEGEDNDEAVAAASHFSADNSAVFGLVVPSKQSITAARAAEQALIIFVPTNQGALKDLFFPDENVFAALDAGHHSTIGDIASSTSKDDRMKQFYHESVACVLRSPLEFTECYRDTPVFVYQGFDLAIDDCINEGTDKFVDYGQCDRLEETIDSPWWHRHRSSFAARQVFSYEQGLGWSFAAWKLYEDHGGDAVFDDPAQLLALKDVEAAGLMPDLHQENPGVHACLNPPVADFELGDRTLAPTPGPPPECVQGCWWNYNMSDCECWVPPATDPPSPHPTPEPVICPPAFSKKRFAESFGGGIIVAAVVGFIGVKLFGPRAGYSQIPSN